MPVKVVFYGWLREEVGKGEVEAEAGRAGEIVGRLGDKVLEELRNGRLIMVVNHSRRVGPEALIGDGDILALLPTPSGG